MVNGCPNVAWRGVARVFREGTLTGLTDQQVLARFVESRDESAFEALLTRHGPMVLNVCRQLLREPHDVDDAFQATFLVLVRKAGSIRVEDSLGPWLYTVACRTAARARRNRRSRGERERSGSELPETGVEFDLAAFETTRVVQEELSRLPERLRNPLILCYLQGLTHELAARQLECPVGTVRSRLARARALLLERIIRRGIAGPVAAVAAILDSNAKAAVVPPKVRESLMKLATRWFSESANLTGGVQITASAASLLEGVLYVMQIKKLAIVATALLSVGILVSVVGATAFSGDGPLDGQAGVHSRGAAAEISKPSQRPPEKVRVTITYYVGDLIGATVPPTGNQPNDDVAQRVKMHPVIKSITTTIAPGTWQTTSDRTSDALESHNQNTIVPFYLSLSLIVRCTPDVHDQVANLLRGLRDVIYARQNAIEAGQKLEPVELPKPPNNNSHSVPLAPAGTAPASASKQRVQELLDELSKEFEKLTTWKRQA